jgi:hypothetical protein
VAEISGERDKSDRRIRGRGPQGIERSVARPVVNEDDLN